jgi:diphthine-ammonia ligase
MTSIAYLWHRNQHELLQEMIDYGLEAVLIKVASYGLKK